MASPPDTVRVFFALWPAAQTRAALAAWQPVLKQACGGRATPARNLHITLAFLGNVAQHRLEALKLAAQEVTGHRFHLTLDQAHYWGHNHIVHAAPGFVPQQLLQLVNALEQSLSRHRFHFDRHPGYRPHATLLRHAKWKDAPLPATPRIPWAINEFVLVQSVTSDQGAVYQVLASFPLS